MSIAQAEAMQATAAQWRASHPHHDDGVVLIWQNEVYGWKNCLRDAGHERPGVYAVNSAGHVFIAEGGDDYNGAKCWVAVGEQQGKPTMSKRPEDLSGDELRALADDLDDRIDLIGDDDEAAAELLEQQSKIGREISKREALEARRAGGYSAELNAGGDLIEYELRARNQADAEAEAQSGAEAMANVTGQSVTVERINGPIGEGE